jgi:hypothetical protein
MWVRICCGVADDCLSVAQQVETGGFPAPVDSRVNETSRGSYLIDCLVSPGCVTSLVYASCTGERPRHQFLFLITIN